MGRGIALLLGVAVTVHLCGLAVTRVMELYEARCDGIDAAQRDIASGTPRIRKPIGLGSLDSDGFGIDLGTGLPLSTTSLLCGTGVDGTAYGIENRAYNRTILSALADGDLHIFDLRAKVRTKDQLAALLAKAGLARLAKDGDTIRAGNGTLAVIYHLRRHGDGSESHWIDVAAKAGDRKTPRLFYPEAYTDRPRALAAARGPFDAMLADNDTSVIVRDVEGYAWIVDLPNAIVVEVAGPIS